ncbi:hypothetical protein Back2_17550 [Nocardioides baekrokdamisoli]|uniref:Uncharacterized protein n=1 Tax=Nocardioides baekrokdamisoli TaxID=1804624 RepID=A0A3G9J1P3_9ACTN|nr:hypothetical protein [Nocardioides baekrokdamisoli]BBH17468.1 hypothetical protein Back2_17550 [Nocardioides baekrokdamisoli]
MATSETEMVGTAEMTAALDVDRATVARWVQRGIAQPAGKLPGPNGAYFFDRSEIERLRVLRGDRKQMPAPEALMRTA